MHEPAKVSSKQPQSDGRTKPMTMVVPRLFCCNMVSVLILLLVLPSAMASVPTDETSSCADESCGANYTLPPIENDGSIGFAFGKRQVVGLTPSKETLNLMRSMNNYMQNQDQKRCTLNFEQCVHWASIGECRSSRTKDRPAGSVQTSPKSSLLLFTGEANPPFMQKECAPACFTCALALMTFEERCPLPKDMHLSNAWQNGALNQFFERLVNDEKIRTEYGLNVLLRPGMSHSTVYSKDQGVPWVVTLDTFLSEQECDMLIRNGHQIGFEQSGVVGVDPKSDETKQSRTSSTAWCRAGCQKEAAPVLDRIELLTGIPQPNFEHLQILRYSVGQFYKVHSDYIQVHLERAHGPRLLTVFLYLNDVDEGESTKAALFPKYSHVRRRWDQFPIAEYRKFRNVFFFPATTNAQLDS
jgi:hypothetical protein